MPAAASVPGQTIVSREHPLLFHMDRCASRGLYIVRQMTASFNSLNPTERHWKRHEDDLSSDEMQQPTLFGLARDTGRS